MSGIRPVPPGRTRRGLRLAALCAGMTLLAAAARAAGVGIEPLSLFQMVSRADRVVHVRVREGALKYAVMDVVEVLKGEPPPSPLRVVFRDLNWRRPAGVDPIVFRNSQEEILFLAPLGEGRRNKHRDLFDLFRGAEGHIPLPAEGALAEVEAVKRLAALAAADPATQVNGLWDLLSSGNARLGESALDEIVRLRAATADRLPQAAALLRNPSGRMKAGALRLIGMIFTSGNALEKGDTSPDELRSALASVLQIAHSDGDEFVRVEAVAAVAAWPDRPEVLGDLQAIAAHDSAQSVRFEAQKALVRQKKQ